MAKYWIGVASHEHVQGAVRGGFAQVCHGKGAPLKRMMPGDWIIYYSPTEFFGSKEPCRKFTAIGCINNRDPYEFCMSSDFVPWRRDVDFKKSKKIDIRPLLHQLSFIKNKQNWGLPFRRGCFEITREDFMMIANLMGTSDE